MFDKLLPSRADNTYPGHTTARDLLGLVPLMFVVMLVGLVRSLRQRA
jgi:hypothetical protein